MNFTYGGIKMNNGFTSIEAKNYKSFKNLNFNIENNSKPKNIIAIYGENGSGKSNILSLISNLQSSTRSIENLKRENEILLEYQNNDDKSNDNQFKSFLNRFDFKSNLNSIFKNAVTINSKEITRIKYNFKLNGKKGDYELAFSNYNNQFKLEEECLNYTINSYKGNMYKIYLKDDEIKYKLNNNIFKNSEVKKDIIENAIYRFWGKHTFLAGLNDVVFNNNKNYIKSKISDNIFSVITFFSDISFLNEDAQMLAIPKKFKLLPGPELISGHTESKEILKYTQEALNDFLMPLYSDLLSLEYDTHEDENGINYRLFETKRMNGEEVKIPFNLESHGTKQLINLFPLIIGAVYGNIVVIDEIDDGIHDLLMNKLVSDIQDSISGQLIFSTHDTSLMKELNSSSVYIIQIDSNGNKRVTPLSSSMIKENNNVQKMYLNGYFSGVPYLSSVDFEEIIDGLNDDEL